MTTPTHRPALDTLRVILRPVPGANKADESMVAAAAVEVQMPGGRVESMLPAWYDLIGDLQLRIMWQRPDELVGLHASELDEAGLTPGDAVATAIANLHRLHGAPTQEDWYDVQRLVGPADVEDSCYLLDRAFWQARLVEHPEGMVVATPRQDALLFAPATDAAAVDSLRAGAPGVHAEAGFHKLSSALYLFKDDRWSVLQPAVPVAPEAD